jgi:teichoic acid transport system permease protein
MKKSMIARFLILAAAVLLNIFYIQIQPSHEQETIGLTIDASADAAFTGRVYYLVNGQSVSKGDVYTEAQSVPASYTDAGKTQTLNFALPANTTYLRFDPSETEMDLEVTSLKLAYKGTELQELSLDKLGALGASDVTIKDGKDGWKLTTTGEDSRIDLGSVDMAKTMSVINDSFATSDLIKKIAILLLMDIIVLLLLWKWKKITEIPRDVWSNKRLILQLAKNDFKTRFAGSYLGIFWAFVQPVITIFVYWFVFEKALHSGAQATKAGIAVPYVLWLIAGLVPWFFFSEALNSATSAMLEYSYLVKKVVFTIDILPVVKVVSCLFVHLFFIGFTVVMYTINGFYPTAHMVQILYYSFAMFILVIALAYFTSAVVIFFRDLSQIIAIVLQVGVWFTPIMWNIDAMSLSGPITFILQLNPMYYVVMGYRDSLINNVWFFEHGTLTIYFWSVVVGLFILGSVVFRRLRTHFADVL